MTSSRDNDLSSRHRLFHAMVLMGGSLALRCGGETATNAGASGAAGAATGGSSTATGGSATGGSATGGSATGGSATGGSASATGGIGFVIPTTGGRATVDPDPLDCPSQQWNCAADAPLCYGSGFALPQHCVCDASRPLSAAACGSGQSFVCYEARYDANGQLLPEPIQFDCSCVQNQLHCGLACDARFSNTGNCSQKDYAETGLREILCGCAVIVLR